MSKTAVLFLGLLSLGSALAATDGACQSLFQLITSTPDHDYFGTALLASGLQLASGQQYTILAPGNTPFGGLLHAYGFNISSAQTIKENPDATRLAGYLKYFIISGSYSSQDLIALAPKQHMKTLFDPATDGNTVCRDPDVPDDNTIKPSDGDLEFAGVGSDLTVIDDSTTTDVATIVTPNLAGCEGFVHLIDNVINPCAPDVKKSSSRSDASR